MNRLTFSPIPSTLRTMHPYAIGFVLGLCLGLLCIDTGLKSSPSPTLPPPSPVLVTGY